jgi:hypothetical protein
MRYLARPTSRAQEPGECVCESGLSSSPPSSLPRRLWRALCLCVWLTGAHRRAASWSRWRRRHRAARRLSANAKSDAPARDCRGRDWLHLDHFMTNLINHSPALFSVVSTRTVSHYRPSLRFHRVISEALTHGVVEEWGREKSASCLPSRPWDSKHLTQHHIGGVYRTTSRSVLGDNGLPLLATSASRQYTADVVSHLQAWTARNKLPAECTVA